MIPIQMMFNHVSACKTGVWFIFEREVIFMLRSKALNDKLLLLGVDGMDPRFTKRLVNEGKMPNFKK